MKTQVGADLYRIMDDAGVTYAGFTNPKKPGLRIVNEMRLSLAKRLTAYIEDREKKIREQYERSENGA